MSRERLGVRLYRWVIRLLPVSAARDAEETVRAFEALLAARRSPTDRALLVLRAFAVLPALLVVEWAEHLWRGTARTDRTGVRDAARCSVGAVLDGLGADVRIALRQMRRSPGFTFVVVGTLALALGANAAIYTVVRTVLIRPLPYTEPDRLVALGEHLRERPSVGGSVSYLNFLDWQRSPEANRVFEGMALRGLSSYVMADGGEPLRVRGGLVTAGFFPLLGAEAAIGRTLAGADDLGAAVLSDRLWRRAFTSDPTAVGRTVDLDGEPFRVVGVMPPWFQSDDASEIWIRLTDDNHSLLDQREVRAYRVLARLAEGMDVEVARGALERLSRSLAETHPEANADWDVTIMPLAERTTAPVRATLLTLFGAVWVLLLLACANVANLLLARADGRAHDTSVRSALGAGRRRIVRQLLTESLVIGLVAAIVGFGLGAAGVRVILALTPTEIPRAPEVAVDAGVFGWTLAVAMVTGVLFGVAPAWFASRGVLAGALRQRPGRGFTPDAGRLQSALMVGQVGLSVVLLVAAGLLVRSFTYLWSYESGFDASRVLTLSMSLDDARYPEIEERDAFFENLYVRLRGLQSVESVGAGTRVPLGAGDIQATVVGRGAPESEGTLAGLRPVSGDYFEAIGLPVLAGRSLRASDRDAAVVNERLARALWPADVPASAVGREVSFRSVDGEPAWLAVIGVAGQTRHAGLDPEPRPELYVRYAEADFGTPTLVIRTNGDPADLADAARDAFHALDPHLPISSLQPMSDLIAASMRRPRFYATLFGVFGALALVIAGMGVFATAVYTTGRRSGEIGVRIALGARRGEVVRGIVLRGTALVGVGVILGLVTALGLRRHAEGLLHGVSPADPISIAGAALVLMTAGLVGHWLPARRSAAVDPATVLRME